jgi:hypothetical protein
MNQDPSPRQPWSRRQFVGNVARSALAAGAAALSSPRGGAADRNPFAYDVSRFSKTDPQLIAWEEISRWTCPAKDARRITFGPDDVLCVAAGQAIIRRGPAGILAPLEFDAPVECVAVASDGTIYAGLRDHIQVFDGRGNRRAKWEVPGRRTWFSSLDVGEHDLFAADSGNRIILRYDRSGKLTGRIGAKDPARNIPGLIVPSPNLVVTIHRDGLLRVTNPGRHRFEAYTVDGDFAGAWGKPSAGITGFCGCCNPVDLAVLSDGRVVTCEKGLPRVKVFGIDGEFESVVAGTESFAANVKACSDPGDCTRGGLAAAVDAQGRIHVLDRVTSEIRVLQPKARA